MVTSVRSEISRPEVVDSLARFRQEWQASVDGQSLMDVQASVGLMLVDVVMLIGLSSNEQQAVLGVELRREFFQAVKRRSNNSR